MKSITLFQFYFGVLPEWMPLYLESLRRNPTINFIFYSDCVFPPTPKNVIIRYTTLYDYIKLINEKLGIEFSPVNLYKLCDIVPFLGYIHEHELRNSDFFGFADSDLIHGDIRKFYPDSLLSKYDMFSTHNDIISGHLALFRNNKFNRELMFTVGGWKEKLQADVCLGLGEVALSIAFKKASKTELNLRTLFFPSRRPRLFFKEQYTTPFTAIPWIDGSLHSAHPDTWFYKDGRITNSRDGERDFMYIHFTNFKSSKYRHDKTPAPWEGKPRICFATPEDMKKGIKISPEGITPI